MRTDLEFLFLTDVHSLQWLRATQGRDTGEECKRKKLELRIWRIDYN